MDNRVSLYKLEVFRLVADLGGVSRAAAELHVSQPVVTAHVRSLEERFGAPLFVRDSRPMALTEAGRIVYRWACDIRSGSIDVDRQLSDLAEGSTGSVSVAGGMSSGSYLLPEIIGEFLQASPRSEVTLHVAPPNVALKSVESGDRDFGVFLAEILSSDADLRVEPIGTEDFVLVAAPSTVRFERPLTAPEIAALPFICPPSGAARRDVEDRALAALGVSSRQVVVELGHPEAMKRLVRSGLGVSLLFRSCVEDDLAAGALMAIPVAAPLPSVPITLAWRADKVFTPVQERLRRLVVERVAERTHT